MTENTLPNHPGIYIIRCSANGRVYVGSAVVVSARWRQHRRHLRLKRHHSPHLQRAWDKYGEAAFVFDLLESVSERNDLIPREQYWIDKMHAADRRRGFNRSPVAGSILGMRLGPMSEKQKQQQSEARKGKPGHPHTDAAKRAISAARKGRPLTDAHRKVLSLAHKGHVHSEATKRAMSEAKKGKKPNLSPDARAAMAAATRLLHTGRTRSEATKRLMSLAQKRYRAARASRVGDASVN